MIKCTGSCFNHVKPCAGLSASRTLQLGRWVERKLRRISTAMGWSSISRMVALCGMGGSILAGMKDEVVHGLDQFPRGEGFDDETAGPLGHGFHGGTMAVDGGNHQ